jgi:CDP-diacylglycerol--serine O-phosphatidyltransferase
VKKIAILPTLLTLGNAVCGFVAIVMASRIDNNPESDLYFAASAWFILAAMLFDGLDGYVARLSKTASEFGAQLDSLCDAISFGVAPAFLLWRLGKDWEMPVARQTLAVVATLFMVCTILRLARYNVESALASGSSKRFKGLPSPAAAGCVLSLAILRGRLVHNWLGIDPVLIDQIIKFWAPVCGLAAALLMVSRLPYPHLTKQILRGRRNFSYVVQIIVLAFMLAMIRELAVVAMFWAYALSVPLHYLWTRGLRERRANLASAQVEERLPH